jgi:hypothetical protein
MSINLDQLSSGLASGTITRRRALAAIGAGALGALLPWASRAESGPQCKTTSGPHGHPCGSPGNVCCPGWECKGDDPGETPPGPGSTPRCVKKKPEDRCNKKKKCEKDKDCDTKHGETCTCNQKVYVEKPEFKCEKGKVTCPKDCECVVKDKKKVCVCKVEKKFCEKKKH